MKLRLNLIYPLIISLIVSFSIKVAAQQPSQANANTAGKAEWKGRFDKKKRKLGRWVYYSKSGAQLIIANYVKGKLHGDYKSFYENGRKKQQCSYIDNLLNGKYEVFYNNKSNSPAVRGAYLAGLKSEKWSRWTLDNKLVSTANYTKGLKDGIYTSLVNNTVYLTLVYKNGLLHGPARRYNIANKKVIEHGMYINNQQQGIWKYWGNDGNKLKKIAHYKNGLLNNTMIQYNENGHKWKVWSYTKGILQGPYTEYFGSSKPRIFISGTYADNERTGVWTYRYASAKVWQRVTYKNNKIQGKYLQYYKSGRVWKITEYVDDKKHGKFVIYTDQNQKRRLLTGQYRNNLQQGKWSYWYPDGKTINKIVIYQNGALNGISTQYYPSGRRWVKSHYKQDELNGSYFKFYNNPRGSIQMRGKYQNSNPVGTWTSWSTLGKIIKRKNYSHKNPKNNI